MIKCVQPPLCSTSKHTKGPLPTVWVKRVLYLHVDWTECLVKIDTDRGCDTAVPATCVSAHCAVLQLLQGRLCKDFWEVTYSVNQEKRKPPSLKGVSHHQNCTPIHWITVTQSLWLLDILGPLNSSCSSCSYPITEILPFTRVKFLQHDLASQMFTVSAKLPWLLLYKQPRWP